jgi:hypothetical protein
MSHFKRYANHPHFSRWDSGAALGVAIALAVATIGMLVT